MEQGREWVGDSWDELKYIRQAVTFLVIGNKPKKSLDDITRDLCPILSIQQLYRISTMYWDEKYNTETVSSEVRSQAASCWWRSSRVAACTVAVCRMPSMLEECMQGHGSAQQRVVHSTSCAASSPQWV
jgi:hypothetical protein